jgi:hypothetical protein
MYTKGMFLSPKMVTIIKRYIHHFTHAEECSLTRIVVPILMVNNQKISLN